MTETLMRLPAVMAATGYKKSTLYQMAKDGRFPKPIKLVGGGATAWRSSEVQRWIDEQCKRAEAA